MRRSAAARAFCHLQVGRAFEPLPSFVASSSWVILCLDREESQL